MEWNGYVQQQEASVNRSVHWSHVRVDADRRQDIRLHSKLAVVVREWTVAIHRASFFIESTYDKC